MKPVLLLSLLLFACAVNAKTVAQATNQSGGLMVLTDEPCANGRNGQMAYTVEPGDASHEGCWILHVGSVYIFWYTLDNVIRYSQSQFKPPAKPDTHL